MKSENKNPLRVLLIEDNKFDQMAFKRMVEHEKLSFDYQVAGSREEAEKKLEQDIFDVIVADFNLGDGTLFDLAHLLKRTPTVVTTGVGDEDIAVTAMKQGAYDYLIKDVDRNYLKVLPLTVTKAVQHKQAEEQNRMLTHAIMCIHDSVYITDVNDNIVFVNKAFCNNYGYREDEILGKTSRTLWQSSTQNQQDMKEIVARMDGASWKNEIVHVRKDGTGFPVSLSRSIIADDEGNEIAVIAVAHILNNVK